MVKSTKDTTEISAKRKKLMRKNNSLKNKKIPLWAIILIIVISMILALVYVVVIGLFAYFAVTDNNAGYYDATENFEITSIDKHYYDETEKEYVIEGTISNKTTKSFDDVEIEYYLYDKNGVVLSVCRAFIDDIKSLENLHFKAVSDENIETIYKYELVRIVEDSNFYNPGSMRVDPIGLNG